MVPTLKDFHSYQDFASIFNLSQLDVRIDGIPLTEDDISEVVRDIWKECTNYRQYKRFICQVP